jgi:hypothetical protein
MRKLQRNNNAVKTTNLFAKKCLNSRRVIIACINICIVEKKLPLLSLSPFGHCFQKGWGKG